MAEQATTKSVHRRHFLNLGLKGIAVVPLGPLYPRGPGLARGGGGGTGGSAETPKLPESDRQAKALGYREDASAVDTTQYKRKDDQFCANCQLFSGSPGDMWGPCAIFSYRMHPKLSKPYEVSAKGWCKSWGPRAG